MGYSPSDFVVSRLEDVKADLYQLNYSQRGLSGIIIGDDGRYLTCGSEYALSKYIEDFKNGVDDYTISPEVYKKTFEKDSEGKFIRLNIPIDYLKELGFNVSENLNLIGKKEEELTKEGLDMLQAVRNALEKRINKSLKLSNGKYAENQETKEAFEKYMEEVKTFNEKVERGEDPGITQGDLLAKYKQQFYDESLEEKEKKLVEDYNNREKETKIDDLIADIDRKLNISSENKSIDEQINEIDERISEIKKEE